MILALAIVTSSLSSIWPNQEYTAAQLKAAGIIVIECEARGIIRNPFTNERGDSGIIQTGFIVNPKLKEIGWYHAFYQLDGKLLVHQDFVSFSFVTPTRIAFDTDPIEGGDGSKIYLDIGPSGVISYRSVQSYVNSLGVRTLNHVTYSGTCHRVPKPVLSGS